MRSTKSKIAPSAESLFLEAYHHEEIGNLKNAFKCLLASARLGDTGAQLNLGNFYATGKGIRRDLAEAARWYQKAYKVGERTGATNLAIDRRNAGRTRSAVIWFKKAIAMNDGDACIELAKLYRHHKTKEKAACDLLRRALLMNRSDISDAGKEEAASLLHDIEISGKGGPR